MHPTTPSPDSSNPSIVDASEEIVAKEDVMIETSKTLSSSSTAESGGKISFSVTKRQTTKIVTTKIRLDRARDAAEEEEEEQQNRKRGVLSLEDGVCIDAEAPNKKREKKVFVIPVVQTSSQLQIERLNRLVDEGTATESDRARLTLLLESLGEVPTQLKNEKFTLPSGDIQTGPTTVIADETDPDYESMPIGEFGLAFLRGCGWKDENSCIGKTNPQAVQLRITTPRPKGLGLGATIPSVLPPIPSNGKRSEKVEQQDRILGKKSYVKCLGGLNKGAYGQITSMDEENSSAFVELSWPPENAGKIVRVSQFTLEIVGQREFRDKTERMEDRKKW